MIFTDEKGVPIPKPERDEYESDVEYVRAFHEWKQRIANMSSEAFDEAFRKAMKG